ncbi:enoyl-CoA hydratase [Salinihabitans flavidus]|uniref:Enoyl-CoA hydratase n=1 Tax=Salinihabitans flavidus TaxID=569882 RepID=A0A1H8PK54_9RHOB|nr:enoyl-CoA hydratase/isomerase family protein [Salinihabitans flavidus]SEO42332.1 enoyl-CoA hydratase [Salinihabitans flavidus]
MTHGSQNTVVVEWPTPEICLLRLARGAQMNTITGEFLDDLGAVLTDLAKSPPRALLLTGSDGAFCGGANIKLFSEKESPLYQNARAIRDVYVRQILDVFGKITALPCPTIALINGHALGGGTELALSFDFRLMSSDARMGLPEVRLGAVAAGNGVQRLHRIVGRAKALEIVLLGEKITAPEALSTGLVMSVHDPDALEAAGLDLARRFLKCSPIAVAESKRAIYRTEALEGNAADEAALDAVLGAAAGPEWTEGMSAFAQKRRPTYATDDTNGVG